MKNALKIGCVSAGAIVGGLLVKLICDICEKNPNIPINLEYDSKEAKRYSQDKKTIYIIGKSNESYMAAARNEEEIQKICEELQDYDDRKERLDKDLENGNDCYWENANKNEFK